MKKPETEKLLAKAERRVKRLKAKGWKQQDFAKALKRELGK